MDNTLIISLNPQSKSIYLDTNQLTIHTVPHRFISSLIFKGLIQQAALNTKGKDEAPEHRWHTKESGMIW